MARWISCSHCGENIPLADAMKWPDGVLSLICPACKRATLLPAEPNA